MFKVIVQVTHWTEYNIKHRSAGSKGLIAAGSSVLNKHSGQVPVFASDGASPPLRVCSTEVKSAVG